MSNKDINKQDAPKNKSESDVSLRDNMHLFSFSLLKSKSKMTLKQHSNSFRFDFSKDNNNESYINKKKKTNNETNNRKISLIDGDKNSSLKTLNIEVPSSERLSDEHFKTDFLNEYDNSFAYYCGINKKQFNDIYIKNRYIPVLNEFGDIKISIKYIVDLLKTYSINVRAGRKILKRNRIKKIFKTQKKKLFYDKNKKNRLLFEVKKDEGLKTLNINNASEQPKNINDLKKVEIKTVKQFDNNNNELLNNGIKKENNNNINTSGGLNKIKNRLLHIRGNINIPKNNNLNLQLGKTPIAPTSSLGLQHITNSNISIANNNNYFNMNTLTNDGNKQFISNNFNNNPTTSFRLGLTAIQPMTDSKQNISPNNNNYFNFNNNITMNYNSNIGNQILSPNTLLSPNRNFLLGPFSPIIINSNLSTPRILSPVLGNIFPDTFTFNNNQNSFMFGNNNNTPFTNNNMNINNNIINNSSNINNINDNKNNNITINNNIKNNIINNSSNNNINDNKNNNFIVNNNMNNNNINNMNSNMNNTNNINNINMNNNNNINNINMNNNNNFIGNKNKDNIYTRKNLTKNLKINI